jgi:hypothetical protein
MVDKKLMEFFLNSDELLEVLSELEHIQWGQWSKSLTETEKLSPERVSRWEKLWIPYGDLSEEDKDFDRIWAMETIRVLKEKLL